jgi:hypothetical protein
MLYTIESTLGGFGDVLVEIFALPKACHSGSVLPLLPLWQGFAHHGYGSCLIVNTPFLLEQRSCRYLYHVDLFMPFLY